MGIIVEIQNATDITNIPSQQQFQLWLTKALSHLPNENEVCIRIVDKHEITELNAHYRQKSKPTNILSFPQELPDSLTLDITPLGDMIICAEVVQQEAKKQGKPEIAHWAHLTIHGALHLIGHDHMKKEEAAIMEQLEINTLQELGYANPYGE